MAFNYLIAIQSAAFLSTLYRKRKVDWVWHQRVYGGCLVLTTFHSIRNCSLTLFLHATLAIIARMKWSVPKYALWTCFASSMCFERSFEKVFDQIRFIATVAPDL